MPGLTVKTLHHFMSLARVTCMLAGNVPVQCIKHILSMYIMYQCGGLFTDLDIYWLGRPIPIGACGYLFSEEACDDHTASSAHHNPSLSMFAMPKGADIAMYLADRWDNYWFHHAHHVIIGEKPAVELVGTNHEGVHDTHGLQAQIAEAPQLVEAYKPSIICCPLSDRLTMDIYNVMKLQEGHVPSVGNNLAIDYVEPSIQTVARTSVCIKIWHQQWPLPLQAHILTECLRMRCQNIGVYPTDIMAKQVDIAITSSIDTVLMLLGKAVGHTVIGFVFALRDCHWLQGLLKGGLGTWEPHHAEWVPESCTDHGLWTGPPISADHWCGALLYLALCLLCFTGHASNPRTMAAPCRGPAFDRAVNFAIGIDKDAWHGIQMPVLAMSPWLLSHYEHHRDISWPFVEGH
jgi:hypothetical protein